MPQARTPGSLRRLILALLISTGLNVLLLTVAFSIDPHREELSRNQSWANSLLMPAGKFTDALVAGHGGAQIVALVLFSVAFYTVVSWVALSLPAWWRRRL
jgi:hypothetical protein